ncbi:MAG TPA: hypothetical protein VL899_14280 [Alphaproteobacteria bacterium]|nr:hypothetical protein [Alphaproteobacteria bacterium]
MGHAKLPGATRRSGAVSRGLALGAVGFLAAGFAAHGAQAETRGYAVSWFYMAAESQNDDCPQGTNPLSEEMATKYMKAMGKSDAEIEALKKDYPANMYGPMYMRGRRDGKPVNVYADPTSQPDPNIKTAQGHVAYGFDLDGKDGPNDFVDPQTGAKGVDDMLYRAVGCFITQRASGGQRPTYPAIQWDMTRDQMPAWIIEVSGIERDAAGKIKDGDVKLGIYRATGPVTRNAAGDPQADMSFTVDSNPRTQNVVHAVMKNGTLTTDPFEFHMIQDPFAVTEYHFKKTQIRLALNDDGTAKGVLGGYQPWLPIYEGFALGGSVNELNLSIDAPGIYYALKKLADFGPDASGQNQYISSSYIIEAVPGFISHPNADKTSMVSGPVKLAATH